jgi:TolB protein
MRVDPAAKPSSGDAAAEAGQLGVDMRSRGQPARLAQLLGGGLIVGAATLLASNPEELMVSAQPSPVVEKFVVDDRGGDQRAPKIDGNWVVWEDYRRTQPSPTATATTGPGTPTPTPGPTLVVNWRADIRARDMSITQDDSKRLPPEINAMQPSVSGNLAVWIEQSSKGDLDLVVYDLNEREFVRRIESGGAHSSPSISGHKIVWQDGRGSTADIRMYDLDKRDESVVQEGDGQQTRPWIDGNLVAWEDDRDGGRIWYRDLASGSLQRIDGVSAAYEPSVNGKYIVFRSGGTADDPQDAGIYLFDTTSRTPTQISSTRGGKRGNPVISPSMVVWWDARDGDRNLYGYDLVKGGNDFRINDDASDQDLPSLSASTVVYQDARGGDRDIRGVRVSLNGTPTPTVTATATAGTVAPPAPGPQPAPPPSNVPHDERYFSNTGFRISNDRFWEYYNLRGRQNSFGYPISREFTFMGFTVQFFQGHILQLRPDGSVGSMNLLQEDIMPATRVNGSTFPASDAALTGSAPQVGSPTYATDVVEFTRRNAPNEFNGQPVGFFDRFMGTVDLATAFPGGSGNASLLPLLNLEIWGVPTSKPQADPSNGGFIYQRFQRSIMHYQTSCRCTERILLADWFRTVITGQGLPGDLAADMANSPFYLQYDNNQPSGVARPAQLPNTDMRFAFEKQ